MVMLEDRRAITIYNNMFQTQTHKWAVYLEKKNSKQTFWCMDELPEDAWRRTTRPMGLSSVEGPLWPHITQS